MYPIFSLRRDVPYVLLELKDCCKEGHVLYVRLHVNGLVRQSR